MYFEIWLHLWFEFKLQSKNSKCVECGLENITCDFILTCLYILHDMKHT